MPDKIGQNNKSNPEPDTGGFWVFGYGSLVWRPGFDFVARHPATIRGYHRALCIYSHVHRGTPQQPGLVLGLDRGGACAGVAYQVEASLREVTLAYLRAREQATMVYREIEIAARLADGRKVQALAYVADRAHGQYAGRLSRAELLAHVRQGVGISGANPEYVRNTHAHLAELGISDTTLEWLSLSLDQA